jgi:haloalkane dehalogenase
VNPKEAAALSQPAWLDTQAYPFAPRYVDLAGGWMHYIDEGRGAPVLFVHGTPTWSFEYRQVIKTLSPHVRCIAPDHLGFGLSERPVRFAYTPEAHAAALKEFVTRLGLDDLTLVVHDFGGPIGLPLCFDPTVRVKRLVLMNTWMWPFDGDPDMQRKARIAGGALGKLLYEYANFSLKVLMPSAYGDKKKLTPAIHRQYLEVFRDRKARVRVLHALARALSGSRDYYASLLAQASKLKPLPTLIIWGMKDSAFQPAQLARWRDLLPYAKVVELPDAGHWPHEEEPDDVARLVLDWTLSAR